jgi:uncharacterized membrane protein AbrB (regulator of aidB expression)
MSLLELVIVLLVVYVLHGFIDLQSPWFPVAAVALLVGGIGVALLLTRVFFLGMKAEHPPGLANILWCIRHCRSIAIRMLRFT